MKKFNSKGWIITDCMCCTWAHPKVFNDSYRKKMWKRITKINMEDKWN